MVSNVICGSVKEWNPHTNSDENVISTIAEVYSNH